MIDYEYKFINGEYVSEPPKCYQTYGDKKWNGGYNFAEGNANSQGYEGLLYLREFGRDPDDQVVTVTGSDGKDIYAPRQDIYVRETNDVTCSGEPMNKSPDAFYGHHFKVTWLSREDVILLPFTSETDVFYDSDTRILYGKTPENRIDKLVEFVEDLPKKQSRNPLAFLIRWN